MGRKVINIVGKRFKRWSVLEEAGRDRYGNVLWKCQCDCGATRIVCGVSLKNGRTKSCGCLTRELSSEANRIDLVKQCFGRLTVLEYVYTKGGYAYWKCLCDCGNEVIVCGNSLRHNRTKSCGCLRKERVSETSYIDGRCSNPEYTKNWRKENKDMVNANAAKRRAQKLKQTPLHANKELINFYYKVAATISGLEVDHIKPLSKGGLHHEDNLQLLPKHLNLSKSNKWPLTKEEKVKYRGIRL